MKILKLINTIGITLLVVFLIIVIFHLWIYIEKDIKLKDNPHFLNYTFYISPTDYKSGNIKNGDLIIVKEVKKINKNDIVLYYKDSTLYDLRILVSSNSVSASLMKDTASDIVTLNNSMIVGKAVKKITGFDKILRLLNNWILSLSIGLLGSGLIIYAQKSLAKPKQIA